MTRLLATAICLIVVGIANADDAANKKYLKDLEGSWLPASMMRAGEAAPAEFLGSTTYVFKGTTLTLQSKKRDGGKDRTATVVVDLAQTPIAIDLTPSDGPDAGKPMLGIASLEKGELKLCWTDARDKATRPKDFTSTKDNKNLIVVLKRAKE